jgi:tetratricopeptide (TPR) repeat protein
VSSGIAQPRPALQARPMRRLLAASLLALSLGCHQDKPPDPSVQADGYYIKATAEYLQGKFDESLKDFETVQKLKPNDPRLPAAMGEVLLSSGKLKEALEKFNAAALADPRRGTNWNRIGYIQLQYGQIDAAKDALMKAISLNPNDFAALEWLGEVDEKKGDVDHAIENFRLAAEATLPKEKARLWMRGERLLRAHDRNAEAAVYLQRARSEGIRDAALYSDLGDLLVRQGDLAGAAKTYEDAAKLNPKDPTLWELVGEIDARLDKPADAEAAYHESLRVKDRAVVHVALARLALARKYRDVAARELDLALKAANGEESRESPEIASLLVDFGRQKDALALYKIAAAEPDAANDAALQHTTAKLAHALHDEATVKAACDRLKEAGKTEPCP